jgi:hypothetical protein
VYSNLTFPPHRLIAKVLKANNRIMVGLSLIITLVGCVLISDWQAIRGDPCHSSFSNAASAYNTTSGYNGTQQLVDTCMAQSNSSHKCFWNPQSRITGDYCDTCEPSCLTLQTSLNFYQFNVGVFLTAIGALLGFIYNNALNSDVTSAKKQGSTTALVIGSSALSRAITPFWCVKSFPWKDQEQ